VPEYIRLAVVRLHKFAWPALKIAKKLGISRVSVNRIAYRAGLRIKPAPKPTKPKPIPNPLYCPIRDGRAELNLTSQIMGDPQPGRRELVASAKPQALNYDFIIHNKAED
jgi:hypothetical protein